MCNTFAASSNKSQCTDGDRSHKGDDDEQGGDDEQSDDDEQGDDDDRDEDDLGIARGLFNEFKLKLGDLIPVSI